MNLSPSFEGLFCGKMLKNAEKCKKVVKKALQRCKNIVKSLQRKGKEENPESEKRTTKQIERITTMTTEEKIKMLTGATAAVIDKETERFLHFH